MAAQRAVRKLLLAVVALYLLFLISVWHVVNRSSARSIAYTVAAWFVSAPQPAARRLQAVPLRRLHCSPNTIFLNRIAHAQNRVASHGKCSSARFEMFQGAGYFLPQWVLLAHTYVNLL